MKLLCRWNQHHLAQEIVAGKPFPSQSVLSLHLAHCADCRRAYEQMTQLNQELAQPMPLPAASEGFALAVCTEILARAQTSQRRVVSKTALAFGSSAAILLCLFLWQASKQQPKLLSGVTLPAAAYVPQEHSQTNTPISTANVQVKKTITLLPQHEVAKTLLQKRPHSRHGRRIAASVRAHHPSHRYHAVVWKPQPQPPIAPFLTPEIRSRHWAQWAAFYETHGDYTHAADAYAHAYSALPTEGTAFCAGQAAENAGDVSQAVLYYSQILRQPLKQKPQTEKGTFLWNSEHDAA